MNKSDDTISRQAVNSLVDELARSLSDRRSGLDSGRDPGEIMEDILQLSSAQPYSLDEWCHDCKEYDHEKHCCPRYNRVIRDALKMRKRGKWIPSVDRWGDIITTVDGYTCSGCGSFNADKDNYCPNCGADMRGEQNG